MKYQIDMFNRMGLGDESAEVSYAKFKEKFIENLLTSEYWETYLGAIFNILDLNDDGVISFEEWKAYYHCLRIDQAHARASFDAMDANSDGVVSKEEFVNFQFEYFFTDENKLGSAILYGPLD